MARKEILMEELVEVLYQWHKGRRINQIKRSTGMDRKTIRKYIDLARGYGLIPDQEAQDYQYYLELAGKIQRGLKTPLESSESFKKTAAYHSTIQKLLEKKYMRGKQVYRILAREYGYSLSYSSFKRYMKTKYPRQVENCLRLETMAGEEAQVDFGSAGMMYDPQEKKMRRSHIFVMTLSYSRHHYVEFVFDQGQMSWVKCHMNAFEYFGGVPSRIVLDNLKSGILHPSTYDPVFNKAYAECSKHYGFIIDPAKIRMARHKGKVERKIPVVRGQFLSTYDYLDIVQANQQVREWSCNDYGMQIHGTTKRKPYEVFLAEEKNQLKELPQEGFDLPLWKNSKVHPDHHIIFDKSYYSLPTRYIGSQVWARGGLYVVQIFYEGNLVKTHERSYIPGKRVTDENDYPPEKAKYLLKTREYYQKQALEYGENVCQLAGRIMGEHAYRNLRKVQGIFSLAKKYGKEAVDLTCKRCLFYEDYRMSTIKKVLEHGFYKEPLEIESENRQMPGVQPELCFLRSADYFVHVKEAK